MVTTWPRQSTTARNVRANADDAVGSGRSLRMRSISGRSRPSAGPADRESGDPSRRLHRGQHQRQSQHRERFGAHRKGGDAKGEVDVLGHPARADQDQPVHQLRELVGELHRDATAERMPDDRDPLDVEHAEQVAHAVRVCRDGVVGARLVGLPVAEQVGGDDGESLGERGLHAAPRRGVVADPVDQQDRGTRSGDPVRAPVAVDGAILQGGRQLTHGRRLGFRGFRAVMSPTSSSDRVAA